MIRLTIAVLAVSVGCAHAQQCKAAPRFANVVDIGPFQPAAAEAEFGKVKGLVAAGEKRITLRIHSGGGSWFAGLALIRGIEDLKKESGARVDCVVDGAAFSMAAIFLESPACDGRFATQRSTILFHNGAGEADGRGTAEDHRQAASWLDALNEAIALSVSGRLGMPVADYQAKVAHGDWMLSVLGALRAHAIDAVVDPSDIAAPVGGEE